MATVEVGYLAAFGAGMLSFASPCVLPVIPAFLSVTTGTRSRGKALARSAGFVAGFSAVFVVLGLSATAAGRTLLRHHGVLTRLSGVVVIAMALVVVAVSRGSLRLGREHRFHPNLDRLGPFATPVAGVAFGFGWTPCIGPVLTSVLAVAATRGRSLEGAGLLTAYSLGLGVPFLVAGAGLARLTRPLGWAKRHSAGITLVSAGLMLAFGVLLVADRLVLVTTTLQRALRAVGLERFITIG